MTFADEGNRVIVAIVVICGIMLLVIAYFTFRLPVVQKPVEKPCEILETSLNNGYKDKGYVNCDYAVASERYGLSTCECDFFKKVMVGNNTFYLLEKEETYYIDDYE